MKRFYSTVIMLAMIVAAWSLTAGGGDDEGGDSFSITIDGNRTEYNSLYQQKVSRIGNWGGDGSNRLSIYVPGLFGYFVINCPSNTDTSSFFKVGYNSFEKDATDIHIGSPRNYRCTYVKGSAIVIKNDGKNLTVRFSQYTFTWHNGGREIMFDGTLNFVSDK